jgi:hypothetical protein
MATLSLSTAIINAMSGSPMTQTSTVSEVGEGISIMEDSIPGCLPELSFQVQVFGTSQSISVAVEQTFATV